MYVNEDPDLDFKTYTAVNTEAIVHLTIIPRARVGYKMIDSQRGATQGSLGRVLWQAPAAKSINGYS